MPLSIVSWNVNSIGARLEVVTRWLDSFGDDTRPDIVCLQELKCIEAKFPLEAFANRGYQALIYGQPTYNGVAILVRDHLTDSISAVQKGFPGETEEAHRRLIAATVAGVRVINVYVPNGQAVGSDKYSYKLGWLAQLRSFLDTECDPAQPLALCGDYNIAPDPLDVHDPAAWEGKVLFSLPERAALQNIKDWGFSDSFRQLYPEAVAYSWWDYRQAAFRRNMGLRIDHIWTTAPLMARCQEVTIDLEPRRWEKPSDHTPVIARFD